MCTCNSLRLSFHITFSDGSSLSSILKYPRTSFTLYDLSKITFDISVGTISHVSFSLISPIVSNAEALESPKTPNISPDVTLSHVLNLLPLYILMLLIF